MNTCTGPRCDRQTAYKDYCHSHYMQFTRTGKTWRLRPRRFATLEESFKYYCPQSLAADECWEWEGAQSAKGYGVASALGKTRLAHRVSYELVAGRKLAPSESLDHKCRNRLCVNLHHLELTTPRENTKRMFAWKNLEAENARLREQVKNLERQILEQKADAA